MSVKERLGNLFSVGKKNSPLEVSGQKKRSAEPLPRMKRFTVENPSSRPIEVLHRGSLKPEEEIQDTETLEEPSDFHPQEISKLKPNTFPTIN